VFIRESNLESKKHLRQNAVKKLHRKDIKKNLKLASTDDTANIRREKL